MTFYSILGQALIGWLLADFISGVLHWIGDSLGDTKLVKWASGFNTDHHADPMAITKETFVKRQATQLVGIVVIGGPWLLLDGFSVLWASTVFGGLMIGESHRWAHAPRKANKFVKVMQEIGLLQSPSHHAKHHRPPHEVRFCVLTNWLNPVLDAVKFWKVLDRMVK